MDFPRINISNKLIRCVLLGSSGLFAGEGITLSVIAVPGLLSSSDPLPAWRLIYRRGKTVAITSILTTATTALHFFYKKGDLRFLACALTSAIVIPYTLKFMKPTNDALFALKGTKAEETGAEAKKLIVTWSGLQWVRTALGVTSFILALNAIIYK